MNYIRWSKRVDGKMSDELNIVIVIGDDGDGQN